MEKFKEEFIAFMVRSKVLTFGDFTTKSGRQTPYFINTGNYQTGGQISMLGGFYAQAIRARLGNDFNVLFGPAYKGIPLAVSTAVALNSLYHHDVSLCFNRKETKDHGEGGSIIGHKLSDGDRVVLIDDVTTAGTSVRESTAVISAAAAVVFRALVVSIDRMEKGAGEASALAEIARDFGMETFAIATIDEVVSCLHNRPVDGEVPIDDACRERIDAYRKVYGAARA